MKQVNRRLLLILIALALAGVGGVYALHKFQQSRNAGSLVTLARLRVKEERKDEALELFARYLNFRPNDDQAHAEFARLLLEKTKNSENPRSLIQPTYKALEEAVRKNPEDSELRQELAEFLLQMGRFGDARQHLELLRSRSGVASQPAVAQKTDAKNPAGPPQPDPTVVAVMLTRSLAGYGNFDEAAAVAGELIGFDLKTREFRPQRAVLSETTQAYIILAAILDEKFRDTEAARRVFEQLVKDNPKDPQAWLALARWQRKMGDLRAAEAAAFQANELAPNNAEVILVAFDIALTARNYGRAEAIVRTGLEMFPLDDRMHRNRALLSMQQQQTDKAVADLREGLEKLPDHPSLTLLLAEALFQKNELQEVEKTVEKLKSLTSDENPAALLLEARMMLARQRWMPAKQKLDQLRPLAAGSDELTRQIDLYLGQCFEQLGQFDEQLEANRRVLSEDINSLQARVGAASALAAAGKSDEALLEFETVAASITPERLASIPQVWSPLLQLRISDQMKRGSSQRDWSTVDGLVDQLQQSKDVSNTQLSLIRADLLVRKGEEDAAIELLTEATEAAPSDVEIWTALAILTMRVKGVPEGRAVLDRMPQNLPDNSALLLLDAQIAAREPGPTASQKLADIERRAEKLPQQQAARLLSGLATITLSMGNRAEAERLLTILLEKTPEDPRVRLMLFEIAYDEQDLEKAGKAADGVAAVSGPESPQARICRASVSILSVRLKQRKAMRKGQGAFELGAEERRGLDMARNLLIEAENERPSLYQIQQLFAEIDTLKGDTPSAIERLRRAVRLSPSNPGVVRQLVSLLYASNRVEEAQQALDSIGPEGIDGMERISAEMGMRSGKFDEAVLLAESSVSKDSKNAGELLWLGQLLGRSGKTERAGDVLERAVEAGPKQQETWLALFSHHLSLGQRKSAENVLTRAMNELPEPDRQLVGAQCEEMLGRIDDAERSYRQAVAIAPDGTSVARGLASFLLRRGRLKPAREELERIVASTVDDPSSRADRVWARRALAELLADGGSYKSLEDALSIVAKNAGPDGQLAPEDLVLQISMLSSRPEPASWRSAIVLLEKLSQTQPLSTEQRLQLARLLEKAGRWEDCRNELMTLVASPNSPPMLKALLVEKLIEHGELSTAKTWMTKVQAAAPDAPLTLSLESKLAMAQNDRPAAVAAVKKLMPSGPVSADRVSQLAAIAKLLEDLGFPKAADKLLTEFASLSKEGMAVRAEFLGRHNRTDEALDLLQQAWDGIPLERTLQTAISIARSKGSVLEGADSDRLERWFAKARRQDPDSVRLVLLLAELRELQGRSAEVADLYRGILGRKDLAPALTAIVANNLAFYLAKPETAAEAKKLIDAAIAELGPHPDLLDTRGLIHLALGENRLAVADLEESILEPTALKYLHLACAQMAAKQTEAARKSLLQAKKLGLQPAHLTPADKERLQRVEDWMKAPLGA